MSTILNQFTGYVPASPFAARVVGPPSALLTDEQRKAASEDPLSFRHAAGRSAGASHAAAVEWLESCRDQGAIRTVGPVVFVYEQCSAFASATGILAEVSLGAYRLGTVKPHESTIAKTTRRMVDYMQTTRIYGNPVALTHRPHPAIEDLIAAHSGREADAKFTTVDGTTHRLWAIVDDAAEELCAQYDDALYVTDGHHRLAAALAVAEREGNPNQTIPAGLFATNELTLRAFARCITDPDLDGDTLVARLQAEHIMVEVDQKQARPTRPNEFGVGIGDRFFRLRIHPTSIAGHDDIDVGLLQDRILGPLLGITDPSRDKRLRFVADLPGFYLRDTAADAWFLPLPTEVGVVMAVADSGRVMPPKSTWFAPKVPSGLAIRLLDPPSSHRPQPH